MITSSTNPAIRQHGVCTGSLWRQEGVNTPTSSHHHTLGDLEYAAAYGNYLETYESLAAYTRGDAAVRCYEVVGASATSSERSFRIVTNQGTHVNCQAVSPKCRDLWLATLNAGLELSLLQQQRPAQATTFEMPAPQAAAHSKKRKPSFSKYCASCGALDSKKTVMAAAAPLFQYGKEVRCDLCHDCHVAQGVVNHLRFVQACMESAQQEQDALQQVWNLCWKVVAPNCPPKTDVAAADVMTATSPGSPDANASAEDKSSNSSSESWAHIEPPESSWIHVAPTQASTTALIELLTSPFRPSISSSISFYLWEAVSARLVKITIAFVAVQGITGQNRRLIGLLL